MIESSRPLRSLRPIVFPTAPTNLVQPVPNAIPDTICWITRVTVIPLAALTTTHLPQDAPTARVVTSTTPQEYASLASLGVKPALPLALWLARFVLVGSSRTISRHAPSAPINVLPVPVSPAVPPVSHSTSRTPTVLIRVSAHSVLTDAALAQVQSSASPASLSTTTRRECARRRVCSKRCSSISSFHVSSVCVFHVSCFAASTLSVLNSLITLRA